MQVIVDRIEGEFLILELPSGEVVNVPKVLVPNAKEGDVINITIAKDKTKERKENINNLMDELFK